MTTGHDWNQAATTMIWVRSTAFTILFTLGTIGFSVAMLVAWPLTSLRGRWRISQAWARYGRWLLAVVCRLHDQVEGLELLPPPPFVILSKHQSAWETVVFMAIFPPVIWVLKRSLIYIPFFGWALRASDQIFINREHGLEAIRTIDRESKRRFSQGFSLVVFPEGTRVAPGRVGDYKAGGVLPALAAGVPIVPVAHNAGAFWGRKAFLKKPGVIQVRIGPPIPTIGLTSKAHKQLLAQVRETIEEMMPPVV